MVLELIAYVPFQTYFLMIIKLPYVKMILCQVCTYNITIKKKHPKLMYYQNEGTLSGDVIPQKCSKSLTEPKYLLLIWDFQMRYYAILNLKGLQNCKLKV